MKNKVVPLHGTENIYNEPYCAFKFIYPFVANK